MTVVGLIAGLALLFVGAELLVRGAVAIAKRFGVSAFLIGVTLVGFGTSTPELTASLGAALAGSPDVAVGNVIGSNIANVLLILGLAAILRPIRTTRTAFVRDGSFLIGFTALTVAVCLTGVIGRWGGAGFLALLAGYVFWTYRTDTTETNGAAGVHREQAEIVDGMERKPGLAAIAAAAGLTGLVGGAWLLVDSAITIARLAGIPEAVIGLTLVAVGTSLPELVISAVASIRGHSDVAFGNIVGSNIFNLLGILGATALVLPLAVPEQIVGFDLWLMLAVTVLAVIFAMTSWRIERWEGGLLVAAYMAYVAVLLSPSARAAVGLP